MIPIETIPVMSSGPPELSRISEDSHHQVF